MHTVFVSLNFVHICLHLCRLINHNIINPYNKFKNIQKSMQACINTLITNMCPIEDVATTACSYIKSNEVICSLSLFHEHCTINLVPWLVAGRICTLAVSFNITSSCMPMTCS